MKIGDNILFATSSPYHGIVVSVNEKTLQVCYGQGLMSKITEIPVGSLLNGKAKKGESVVFEVCSVDKGIVKGVFFENVAVLCGNALLKVSHCHIFQQ